MYTNGKTNKQKKTFPSKRNIVVLFRKQHLHTYFMSNSMRFASTGSYASGVDINKNQLSNYTHTACVNIYELCAYVSYSAVVGSWVCLQVWDASGQKEVPLLHPYTHACTHAHTNTRDNLSILISKHQTLLA